MTDSAKRREERHQQRLEEIQRRGAERQAKIAAWAERNGARPPAQSPLVAPPALEEPLASAVAAHLEPRRVGRAYAWLVFGGVFGLHKQYLMRDATMWFYRFTLGGFVVGMVIDYFTLPAQVRACNRRIEDGSWLLDPSAGYVPPAI